MIEVGFATHKGSVRENNEDALLVMAEEKIFIIADGVGGNNAGEVASHTAVNRVAEYVKNKNVSDLRGDEEIAVYLRDCMKDVNESVLDVGKKLNEHSGMATTLVMCYLGDDFAYLANVGDSRAYVYRRGELFRLTEDHTYVNTLVKLGLITEEESRIHKEGHVITRAMGADEVVEPDIYRTDVEPGDIVMMCTDGLYGEVVDEDMSLLFDDVDDMQILADSLLNEANQAGGRDNITVVCLKVAGGETNGQ